MDAQLRFNVSNQKIKRTDSFNAVAKSVDYLYAHFDFLTDEWDGKTKTAIFATETDAYEMILDENGECKVPWEVLANDNSYVFVSVFADNGTVITVNLAKVFVGKTGHTDELETSKEPTPSVYAQILQSIADVRDYVEERTENVDGGLLTDWS